MSDNNIPAGFTGKALGDSSVRLMDEASQSDEIGELAEALARAQGEITGAAKGSSNPFFNSKYADLAACWDACRGPLSENGIAVIQTTEGTGDSVTVVTTLAHRSGQWIRGRLTMTPDRPGPQALGSCITYARRYALAAAVGLAQVDDDAESATFRMSKMMEGKIRNAMEKAIADGDHHAAWEVWHELSEEEKTYMNANIDNARKRSWKAFLGEAYSIVNAQVDPNLADPLPLEDSEKDSRRKQVRSSK